MQKKLRDYPSCERCWHKATCVHHWAGRRWNLLKYEYFKSSCWNCNQFAKDHPAQARKEGWLAPVGIYAT